jgi:erythromycin esterase-like protein
LEKPLESRDLNLGQLVREYYKTEALIVGQLLYSGKVTAAADWDAPHNIQNVLPALPNSFEDIFHQYCAKFNLADFALDLRDPDTKAIFAEPRLERAIGVIYRPETEVYVAGDRY